MSEEKSHAEKAREYFENGCNCAQAVVMAYADELGVDKDTLLKMSASFGGGMGRMREVCGAVSGAIAVAGIKYAPSDVKDTKLKAEHYKLVREIMQRFKEENGSYICRELLSGVNTDSSAAPSERNTEYYKKRPCAELVENAAKIADEVFAAMRG